MTIVRAVGALKFLWPRSKVILIDAVSAGSILGSIFISQDFNIDKLIEILKEIERDGPRSIFRSDSFGGIPHYVGDSLYDNGGLKKLIDRYVIPEKIYAWEGEFLVAAENLTRDVTMAFSNKDPDILKRRDRDEIVRLWILASASLDGVFPDVPIDGELYNDGLTCSLEASVEREIDNIFILINRRLNSGIEESQEDIHWWLKLLNRQRRLALKAVRKKVVADIKYLKSEGYQVIEQNETGIFDKVKVKPTARFRQVAKDLASALNPLSGEPLEDRGIFEKKTIIFTPTRPIKALGFDSWGKQDISNQIEQSIKEIEEYAEKLEREF